MEIIAGVDEAGRGPLAGPVVAAAVILSDDTIEGLRDSKKLSAKKREALYQEISEKAISVGIGIVSEKEIDIIPANVRFAERAVVQDVDAK